MELRKDLELIEVVYENDDKKAVMRFLDEDNGELLEVNFNKQEYDPTNKKWKDNDEKAEKAEKWAKDYFDTDFDQIHSREGDRFDVYKYDTFNSLWEVDMVEKFDEKDKGKIIDTEIKEVVDTGIKIAVRYEWENKTYESKFNYSTWVDARQQYFVDPQKKAKQYERFEETFGVPVEEAEFIIGKPLMVEIKLAFGRPYGEIKKPNWA